MNTSSHAIRTRSLTCLLALFAVHGAKTASGASQAQQASGSATLTITVSPVDPSSIEVRFTRGDTTARQLLVTNVLIGSNASPAIEGIPLNKIASVLTGWFLVQQTGREFWVGTELGPQEGEQTVSIPVLSLLRPLKRKDVDFEVVIGSKDSALLRSATGALSYAPVDQINLVLPLALRPVTTSDWRLTGEANGQATYELTTPPPKGPFAVQLEDTSSPWMHIINEAATALFGSLAAVLVFAVTGALFLVGRGFAQKHVRLGMVLGTAVLAVLLILMANSVNWSLQETLLQGRYLVGAFLGMLLPTTAPLVAWTGLTDFLKKLKELD